MTPGEYSPPCNTHYRHIPVHDIPQDVIWAAMGREGAIFKAITHQANVKYIWFREEKGWIEIWGAHRFLAEAESRIRRRIQDVSDNWERKRLKNAEELSLPSRNIEADSTPLEGTA